MLDLIYSYADHAELETGQYRLASPVDKTTCGIYQSFA